MWEKVRAAYQEYLDIAELFRKNDPTAQEAWKKFFHARNGYSLASLAINNPKKYGF